MPFRMDETWPSMLCPYSLKFFTKPVTTPEGITYEKSEILSWLKQHSVDPLTGRPLTKKELFPNLNLEGMIPFFQARWTTDAQYNKQRRELKLFKNDFHTLVAKIARIQKRERLKSYMWAGAGLIFVMGYLWKQFVETPAKSVVDKAAEEGQGALVATVVPSVWGLVAKPFMSMMDSIAGVTSEYFPSYFGEAYNAYLQDSSQCVTQNKVDFCERAFNFAITHKRADMLQEMIRSAYENNRLKSHFHQVLEKIFTDALYEDDVEKIKLFYRASPELVLSNQGGVVQALKVGSKKVARFLLESGASPNSMFNGYTALNNAAYRGDDETLKLLIKQGADIHLASTSGETPLQSAISGGHENTVAFLLNEGAKLMPTHLQLIVQYNLQTILEKVIQLRPKQMRKMLKKLEVEIGDAAISPRIVELLLEAGAPLNGLNDNHGLLGNAMRVGAHEVVAMLISKGAQIPSGVLAGTAPNFIRSMGRLVSGGFEILAEDNWTISEKTLSNIAYAAKILADAGGVDFKNSAKKGLKAIFVYAVKKNFLDLLEKFKSEKWLNPETMSTLVSKHKIRSYHSEYPSFYGVHTDKIKVPPPLKLPSKRY